MIQIARNMTLQIRFLLDGYAAMVRNEIVPLPATENSFNKTPAQVDQLDTI